MKIININDFEKDYAVEIEKTEKYYQTAKDLSDYLLSLPLSNAENEHIIDLMVKHAHAAERSGYLNGFKMGKEFAETMAKL